MSKDGLLTVSTADAAAVTGALQAALAGDKAIAILPAGNSPRTQAILTAIAPTKPVPDAIALVATTSGSTGQPKAVLISRDAIMASIDAVNLELGITPHWHLVLPTHHIAGAMTAIRGLATDSKLHQPIINAADPMQLAAYAKSVKDLAGLHAITLVPEHLRRLEVIDELSALRYFHKVIVGAGGLSTQLREKLNDANVSVVSSYGLTETCGGIVWDGLPLNSVSISLNGTSEVIVESAMNATGYRDSDIELSVLNTGDIGDLSDGKLRIVGRTDNKVKIKGHFLDLAQLASLCTQLTNSPSIGLIIDDELHLAIEGDAIDEFELRTNLVAELGSGVKGCKIHFYHKLPRTDLNKIDSFLLRLELTNAGDNK